MQKRHYLSSVLLAWLALVGLAISAPPVASQSALAPVIAEQAATISSDRYGADLRFLAAPAMEGRGNGGAGLERAAEYLAEQFRLAGLRPAGDDGGYFQRFEVTTDTAIGEANRLVLGSTELQPGQDFLPVRLSAAAEVRGPLVFVGYGITAPEMHWDDYRGVDVTGKIVVAFRHEPQENDADSPFNGTESTSHATLMNKAINAKQHGAAGILFIMDPNNHGPDDEEIVATANRSEVDNSGIVAAYARMQPVLEYFRASGFDLGQLQREIDERLESRSFELTGSDAVLRTDVVRVRTPVRNVIAALEGSDPALRNEWVVIGAHYDHLGTDAEFSLAPDGEGQIHHGADDNASGTSGILELARAAAAHRDSFDRSVLFIGFAAEEIGLLGSSYFVNYPTVDIDDVVAMINLDMIGRIRDDRVFASGVGTSPEFRGLIEGLKDAAGLQVDYSDSGMGASDHMSFNLKKIPVLFFFSGLHSDYHRPSDTAEKINVDGAVRVLRLVYMAASHLAQAERPLYTEVESLGPVGTGGGGYGVYFGSVPDFRDGLGGVLFADVTAGSPAAQAGLAAGDLLVEFNGKLIENLYDFTYALQAQVPGDEVGVVVVRSGVRVNAQVKLGSR